MNEWLDDLAEALNGPRISSEEVRAVLKVAREVAHSTERRFAPVSTFLIGVAVGQETASGTTREEAIRRAVETAMALLPPEAEASEES